MCWRMWLGCMCHCAHLEALGTILSFDIASHLLGMSMTGRSDFPPILCMKCKVVWHALSTGCHHHYHSRPQLRWVTMISRPFVLIFLRVGRLSSLKVCCYCFVSSHDLLLRGRSTFPSAYLTPWISTFLQCLRSSPVSTCKSQQCQIFFLTCGNLR